VNATEPGGNVRGFYAALGVALPSSAQTEASVRCFADPDAHRHHDRNPSCSVNLYSGAFNCHGCGARGGAYDAALATGRSPREAIDLMVGYGLIDRRPRRGRPRGASPARDTSAARVRGTGQQTSRSPADEPRLAATGERVGAWARSLSENRQLLARLRRERGWDQRVLRDLRVGFDGQRITLPITDDQGELQGVLRLRIWDWQRPKVVSAPGTRLGLIPRPTPSEARLLVVEGPSDMLAACSAGLPAVAVPGTNAWRPGWATAFRGRDVTVVMDCDRPGRKAAARIAEDLGRGGAHPRIVDLAHERDDGYDLSDWLRAGNDPGLLTARSDTSAAHTRVARPGGDAWTVAGSHARPTISALPQGPVSTANLDGGQTSLGCARS
jgi:hypothetical protein